MTWWAIQPCNTRWRPIVPEPTASPPTFRSCLEGNKHDLEWFFDDWVYRDRGLPDFRIDTAFCASCSSEPGNEYQVTVTIENRGGAGAEVPVVVADC